MVWKKRERKKEGGGEGEHEREKEISFCSFTLLHPTSHSHFIFILFSFLTFLPLYASHSRSLFFLVSLTFLSPSLLFLLTRALSLSLSSCFSITIFTLNLFNYLSLQPGDHFFSFNLFTSHFLALSHSLTDSLTHSLTYLPSLFSTLLFESEASSKRASKKMFNILKIWMLCGASIPFCHSSISFTGLTFNLRSFALFHLNSNI